MRPLRLSAAVIAGAAILTLSLSSPALAADGADPLLELSMDGIHFAPKNLPNVLAMGGGIVPGESRTGRIWVRNSGSQTAQFSLAVRNMTAGSSAGLTTHLQLDAGAPPWNVTTNIPPNFGQCSAMVVDRKLSAGEAVPIELDLTFSSAAPNATRKLKSSFDVVFLLQDLDGGVLVSPCALPSVAQSGGALAGRVTVGSDVWAPSEGTSDSIPSEREEPLMSVAPWSADATPQSNVVAISRSPWPWLALVGAGAYVGVSLRRNRVNEGQHERR